jgi:hypothetical protein
MPKILLRSVAVFVLTAGPAAQALPGQTPPPKESLLVTLMRIAGLTATPSQMRGPEDEVRAGNIWLVAVDGVGARALTTEGGFRSPVFSISDNSSLFALKGDAIVQMDVTAGRAVQQRRAAAVTKLVGFDSSDRDALVVLLDNSAAPLGVISMRTGRIAPLTYDPASPDDRRMLVQVRGDERVYGDTSVFTKTETKRGLARNIDWLDVFVKPGSAPARNVSACDGINCVQPALSTDGRRIAFIKTD